MSDIPNHYKTLGIALHSTRAEVREAYLKVARQHHPDKGGDAGEFARAATAYHLLYDERSRRGYNARLLLALPACRSCGGKGGRKRYLRGQNAPVVAKCETCEGTGAVWPVENGAGK